MIQAGYKMVSSLVCNQKDTSHKEIAEDAIAIDEIQLLGHKLARRVRIYNNKRVKGLLFLAEGVIIDKIFKNINLNTLQWMFQMIYGTNRANLP